MMESYTSDSSDSDNSSKSLDFSHQSFNCQGLDDELSSTRFPEQVETLLLHQNPLIEVPSSIVRFNNLNVLDISNCNLRRLPQFLDDCPLTCLVAKNNNLSNKSLPKSFEGLPELRELNLNGNRLTDFPEQVLDLQSLKYLYLGGNSITEITKDIRKLQR